MAVSEDVKLVLCIANYSPAIANDVLGEMDTNAMAGEITTVRVHQSLRKAHILIVTLD